MEHHYLKLSNQTNFTPKFIRGYSSDILRGRKIINNYPKTAKHSSETINDFYSHKNYNYYPNGSKVFISSSNSINFFSPNRNILKNNYRKIKSSKPKKKSSSFHRLLPTVVNNNHNKSEIQNRFGFETEKLYIETLQIKKVIKELEKELYYLSHENLIRDEQLNEKEREINNIINNNYKTIEDEFNDDYKDNYNNYNDININNVNSSMGVLILKIKKEIKNTNNEIKNENYKLNYLKRSLYITKIKELKVESKLLKQQFNKINTLIENALEIRNQNNRILDEYKNLKENINRQEVILSTLDKDCMSLEKKENFLSHQLNILKSELKVKLEKAKKNDNELNILSLKRQNLNNNKIIKSESYTTKINGIPITIKSLYTNKISDLRKNINFYKKQCKYSDDMINKLKEQRKKLIDANKNFEQKIKISSNFLETTTKIKNLKRPQSSLGPLKENMKDEDVINNLKVQYKSFKDNELILEQKANTYFEKLQEIDLEEKQKREEQERIEQENQIEFGIDESNPYYTDNDENVPESHIKFTSSQFNQFTYILFKNFEAKFIVADEANNKIILPFYELIKKYNILKVSYPSKEFDKIIEEFTKVIMTVLNSDNEYNHTITKIFVGALLYNCECDTNKLVEYFSILFGYTRNYVLEEKNLIDKLKTKYKSQTKKLVECITSYILNDLSSSPYFSLFKMKDLLDKNEINLKDKYIEFLFYYMKKFNDPDAKLEDLKFSLLNDIVPIGDTTVHSKAFINDLDKDIELENNENENFDEDININQKEQDVKKETSYENIERDDKDKKKKDVNKNINKEINKEIKKDIKKDKNKAKNKDRDVNKEVEENNKDINENENIMENKENQEYNKNKDNNENNNIDDKKDINKNEDDNINIDINNDKKESKINFENNDKIENNERKKTDKENGTESYDNKDKDNINIEDQKTDNNIDVAQNMNEDINKEEIENLNENDKIKNIEKIINDIDEENSKNDDNKDKINENINNNTNENIKNNENNTDNNNNINNIINNSEKNIENDIDDNNNNKDTENNQNNEPKINNEIDKEEILETGNYEKDDKNIKTKSDESKKKKKKKKKYKEEEYINDNENEDIKDNKDKDKEDQKSHNSNNNNNGETNINNDDDSVTEITNEEYRKQIIDSINLIQNAIGNNSTDFNSLMNGVINKNMIDGELYQYINIEDFNEKIISLGVTLTDLQLSCLCSKFSVPNELRLIDKIKFEKSLEDNLNGVLKIE